MRTVKHEKKKGAKVNEKQVQTRNEASNICTQVMIMNEAATTRFSEQVKLSMNEELSWLIYDV